MVAKKPSAANSSAAANKRMAVGGLTIGQDDDVLLLAGGCRRRQQLLGHMDTSLLVGAAIGVGGGIHSGLEGRQLRGRVEVAAVVRRGRIDKGDDGDAGSAPFGKQLLTEGLGSLAGVGELVPSILPEQSMTRTTSEVVL